MKAKTIRRMEPKALEKRAGAVASLLGALANDRRLLVLCKLVEDGEATVGGLAGEVGLSQSALSQHLARMREEGLVTYRRDAQTLWYRIADPRVESLLATLHRLYCQD
ncbi:MAG: metalloregulator ArsR/SmtB family transcription factor [Reyranellaceae bacterium]